MKTSEYIKQIIRNLEMIEERGYSNVFGDWVDLMIYALTKQEDEYMRTMGRYRNNSPVGKREADYFAEAFGQLMMATQDIQHDAIGIVYEEFAASSKSHQQALGQFFTPSNICTMMGKMLRADDPDKEEAVLDPACGSGRLLVSMMIERPNNHYTGIDLDPICTKMTALNMLFFNVNGYALNGDSIKCTVEWGFETRHSFLGGMIREITREQAEEIEQKIVDTWEARKNETNQPADAHDTDVPRIIETEQLTLFGEI